MNSKSYFENPLSPGASGYTTICKWKDGKRAAFCISGDDTLHSHLDFLIPELAKRGFAGTFWINPGLETTHTKGFCWSSRKEEWLAAAKNGNDFGNHTMHHNSVDNEKDAEYEMGECARIIHEANPGQKLQLLVLGGGSVWNISDEAIEMLFKKYNCVPGRGGGIERPCCHKDPNTGTFSSSAAEELEHYVDDAISEGSWHLIPCHGTGDEGEWLTTTTQPLLALLDYLVEKQDMVWVGTNTTIHKYFTEYATARVETLEASDIMFRIGLASDADPELYDYPLTLKTFLPHGWNHCKVTQANTSKTYPVNEGLVQYEAVPGKGEIVLEKSSEKF